MSEFESPTHDVPHAVKFFQDMPAGGGTEYRRTEDASSEEVQTTDESTVDSEPKPEIPARILHADQIAQIEVNRRLIYQLDQKADETIARLDNLGQGVKLIYDMVGGLVQMLSAVQQVASMMPGGMGKRFAKAMSAQQEGQTNGNA